MNMNKSLQKLNNSTKRNAGRNYLLHPNEVELDYQLSSRNAKIKLALDISFSSDLKPNDASQSSLLLSKQYTPSYSSASINKNYDRIMQVNKFAQKLCTIKKSCKEINEQIHNKSNSIVEKLCMIQKLKKLISDAEYENQDLHRCLLSILITKLDRNSINFRDEVL